MSKQAKHLTDADFDEVISTGITLVDFWADWCGPCKSLVPVMDELAEEFDGRATIAKANVEEAPQVAARYAVRSLPAIFIFKDGDLLGQSVGATDKTALVATLEEAEDH